MKIDLNKLSSVKKYILVEFYIALKNNDYDKIEKIADKAKRLIKLKRMIRN